MSITGRTTVYGLLGSPVTHSRSPRLHNGLFAHYGLDAAYLAFPVDPRTPGAALVSAIRTLGLTGANLTVPFKQRVLPHLDALAPSASRAEAVNTITVKDGLLIGHNTDGSGLVAAVESTGHRPRRAMVLGAGGTGRAVAAALQDHGCAVVLLNRTEARALEVARRLGIDAGPLTPEAFSENAVEMDIVVNCCTPAADAMVARLDATRLPSSALWVDANYFNPQPPHSATIGGRFQPGTEMLLHQGIQAFALWTGTTVPAALPRQLGVAP